MPKTNTTLEELAAKPRWTADDARRVLGAQAGGETQEQLGARLRLDPGRLSRWRSRLARLDAAPPMAGPGSAASRRTRRQASRRPAPTVAFAEAGAMTLGRARPSVIIEMTDEHLRVEVWDPSTLEVCLAALRARPVR